MGSGMELIDVAKRRCTRAMDKIERMDTSKITTSCKGTLLKLATSELNFLSASHLHKSLPLRWLSGSLLPYIVFGFWALVRVSSGTWNFSMLEFCFFILLLLLLFKKSSMFSIFCSFGFWEFLCTLFLLFVLNFIHWCDITYYLRDENGCWMNWGNINVILLSQSQHRPSGGGASHSWAAFHHWSVACVQADSLISHSWKWWGRWFLWSQGCLCWHSMHSQ